MKSQTSFSMRPQTCIPGARLLRDDENQIVLDNKNRPVWQKPEPVGYARHFKNEAYARKHENGELIDLEQGTVKVPIYKGMNKSLYRYLKSQARRDAKKQAFNFTEIIEDDNNISEGNSGQYVVSGDTPDNAGVEVS